MTKLLASVTNLAEAEIVLDAGVDIIDLKNPATGAFGALPDKEIQAIVKVVAGIKPVSATIGDQPMEPDLVMCATVQMAQMGVDIIKIGFFGSSGHRACIKALKPLADRGLRIVAVLLADQTPDFSLLPELKAAGFYGVMLDTAKKNGSSLLDHILLGDLQCFVQSAQAYQLECGLAGSLGLQHIPALTALNPDYLGFRGALCMNNVRTAALSHNRVNEVQAMLYKSYKVEADEIKA